MTDEMTMKNQQPSALPYLAGGGIVGGLGGYYGLPKIDKVNKFMTGPARYGSFEEIIAEADDKFTKAVGEATGEEKTLMEKAAEARKAGVDAGAKWEADLASYKEAYKPGELAPLEEGHSLLTRQNELQSQIATLEKETAAGTVPRNADPARIRNVKSLLEKEVHAREAATKELNEAIQSMAKDKFEAISQFESLEEFIRQQEKNGASKEEIAQAKSKLKELRKFIQTKEKETAEELTSKIMKEFRLSGKEGKKIAEAKAKEILTQVQDIIAEKTRSEAVISTKPVITAEAHVLDAVTKQGEKDLITLARNYKEKPAEYAKSMERTISSAKLKLNKLTEFQSLYTEAVKTAPAGEKQVVEELKILFGLVKKTKTTLSPEMQALERVFLGMEEKAQNDLMRILGNHTLDAEGLSKAIEEQSARIKALESSKTAIDTYHRQLVELGGEGAYVKNGVLYAKDGKAVALKMEEVSLSAKEIAVPKSGKEISLEKQLAQMGEASESTLTKEQLAAKTKELEAARGELKTVEGEILEARKALGKNPEKTAEQLAKDFAEKNGAKEDVVKKAQESFKDDVKKLFEGKRGGKFWGVVAGTVAAGALIGLALKPSNKS